MLKGGLPPNLRLTHSCTRNFQEFWRLYVRAHSQPGTRGFHFAGTGIGWTLLASGLAFGKWWLVLLALIVPYPIVWFSHFFIEHNTPATFRHPAWSWLADQKMVGMMLLGRMTGEVKKFASQSEKEPVAEGRG